jgi:hypothetical protein
VREGERAHRQVRPAVLDRQLAQVALAQHGVRHALAGDVEHLGRAVDADGLPAAGHELLRVPARAAARVDRRRPAPGPELVQQGGHDGILGADRAVALAVVGLRPGGVALAGLHLGQPRGAPVPSSVATSWAIASRWTATSCSSVARRRASPCRPSS